MEWDAMRIPAIVFVLLIISIQARAAGYKVERQMGKGQLKSISHGLNMSLLKKYQKINLYTLKYNTFQMVNQKK